MMYSVKAARSEPPPSLGGLGYTKKEKAPQWDPCLTFVSLTATKKAADYPEL